MNLTQFLHLIRKRDTLILSVAVAVFILFLAASQLSESRYRSSGKIIIYPAQTGQRDTSSSDWRTHFDLLHTFLQSQNFLMRVVQRVGDGHMDWDKLRKSTTIQLLAGYPGQANIIQFEVTASKSEQARQMVDAQIKELIDYIPTFSAEEFTRNVQFLKGLKDVAEGRLREAESKIADWQSKHQVLDVGDAAHDYGSSLAKLQSKEDEMQQQVRSLADRVSQLQQFAASGDTSVPPWLLLEQKNDAIPTLQQKLAEEQAKLADVRAQYQPGEAPVQLAEVREQKAAAEFKDAVHHYVQSLLTEKQSQLMEAKGQLSAVQTSEKRMKATWGLAQNNLEYSKLTRQITALQADFDSLRTQYEAALIAEQNARRDGSIKVLEEPAAGMLVPTLLGKDLSQALPLIIPLSLIAGVLAAYAAERLRTTGTMHSAVESMLGVPVLASIPRMPAKIVEKWQDMRDEIEIVTPPGPAQPAETSAQSQSAV